MREVVATGAPPGCEKWKQTTNSYKKNVHVRAVQLVKFYIKLHAKFQKLALGMVKTGPRQLTAN